MKHLIFGAGNLIFSDEGFGVHFIRYMQEHYEFPENVDVYDGGTLGIMVSHMLEAADHVLLVDVIEAKGEPGDIFKYEKEDFMLNRIPIKMSPHQIGIQEVLTLSDLRDRCPAKVTLYGLIPESYATSDQLTPTLAAKLPVVADMVVADLAAEGVTLIKR